jgi:glutamate-ammonia-ligase adenylyltransferase
MAEQNLSNIEAFILSMPDPQAARVFLERLENQHPAHAAKCKRHPLLLSRLLTLAAYSPFLAENVLRHPDDIDWFEREMQRGFGIVKTTEQISEDLSRFVTRMFNADEKSLLLRFKNRELLRIYLRDCLGIATLAEVTEELSNLADVILAYALKISLQEIINKHGAPLVRDERGRIGPAEFTIIALGKLGCRELNYASDIDLMFFYSGSGETAGNGLRADSSISNKDFYTKVAQRLIQAISGLTNEGAVYRIDLRLRPYGRDGDLIWEVKQAANYYHTKAESWERQMLIRARASAGSEAVFTLFFDLVRDIVFSAASTTQALAEVRRAKEKIDRKIAAQSGGFNVKLGVGGIREVEFIAQALQLAYGGREPWVRSAQTLIVLARLAEKNYLSEPERTALSAAYTFFRIVEHRLQMEHGAQTHTLPLVEEKLELLARRCGYQTVRDIFSPKPEGFASPGQAALAFKRDIERHSLNVRAIYNRVFGDSSAAPETGKAPTPTAAQPIQAFSEPLDEETERLVQQATAAITKLMTAAPDDLWPGGTIENSAVENLVTERLGDTINPTRALKALFAWAESFSTYNQEHTRAVLEILLGDLPTVIRRLITTFSSQYLSSILVSRPLLTAALVDRKANRTVEDFTRAFREAIDRNDNLAAKADALRRLWHEQILAIGYRDLATTVPGPGPDNDSPPSSDTRHRTLDPLRVSNLAQTALAESALQLATEMTLESFGARQPLPFVVMALGRLGHTGMDYGSDLDLLVVFDDTALWAPPEENLKPFATAQEFYANFTARLAQTLSTITREGFIYRVDLRLRPEGKNGQLAQGLNGLTAYLTERASAWEHSAYLKVREVSGDLRFGERVRHEICQAVFAAAAKNAALREDLAAMRGRLEREKAGANQRDLKWGVGGMTDVYFITRYIQLRDRLPFPPERGTAALIQYLGQSGGLTADAAQKLFDGYSFLRKTDHWMRLLLDRPTSILPASQIALADLVQALRLPSIAEFDFEYAHHTQEIRLIFNRIFA